MMTTYQFNGVIIMSAENPVFIPGPTNIPDRLRQAMNGQTQDHRAPDVTSKFAPLLQRLKQVYKTEAGSVLVFPASGTGGWEAAITNTLSPGDKILAASYGVFSDKWIAMCRKHKLEVQVVDCEWGTGVPAQNFTEILTADKEHKIKAVLATHNETATGVRSDIAAVRRALDASGHSALLFVDGVSSIASMDFQMDEWGVDVAVAGSQKGFMLAAGAAIVAISPKAVKASKTSECTRFYLDFGEMIKANASGGYPYTPPLPLINGLIESLAMLLDEEGLEAVYARHHRIAEGVRRAVKAWGLTLVAKSPDLYSDTVSAIYVPDGFDSNALTDHAYERYGVSFGVGLGKLNGKAFRIGHLGMLTEVQALAGLATIEMAMKDLNFPIELGSGVAAAQDYYRAANANPVHQAA